MASPRLCKSSRDPRRRAVRADSRAAFTLVELLVVIGIIAVLLSILLPIASKIRYQSKEFACLAQMRQIGMAIGTYRQTSEDVYPTQPSGQHVPTTSPDSWVYKLRKILPDTKGFACTLGSNSEGDVPRPGEVSYLYNGYAACVNVLTSDTAVRSTRIRRPAETLLITDHAPFDPGSWSFAYAEGYQQGWWWWYPHPRYSGAVTGPDPRAVRRSVCFMDGHAELAVHDSFEQWQADFRLKP